MEIPKTLEGDIKKASPDKKIGRVLEGDDRYEYTITLADGSNFSKNYLLHQDFGGDFNKMLEKASRDFKESGFRNEEGACLAKWDLQGEGYKIVERYPLTTPGEKSEIKK